MRTILILVGVFILGVMMSAVVKKNQAVQKLMSSMGMSTDVPFDTEIEKF